MTFFPKGPLAIKFSEMVFDPSSFKLQRFVDLRLLVRMLWRAKVRVLQHFDEFVHCQMNEFERKSRRNNLKILKYLHITF